MNNEQIVTIALEGMKFYAYHGVYAEEQKIGREFIVSVYLDCHCEIDGSDELGDTFNYEWIYEVAKEEMSKSKKLLETVAYFIGKGLQAKSKKLHSGVIKISKESLILGGEVERSMIEYKF